MGPHESCTAVSACPMGSHDTLGATLLGGEERLHAPRRRRLVIAAAVRACVGLVAAVAVGGFMYSTSDRAENSPLYMKVGASEELFVAKNCDLHCKHGGTPNADCTKCEGCAGAWGGDLCDKFDSSVPPQKSLDELNDLSKKQKEELEKLKALNPIPGTVGYGVDLTNGNLRLPVIQLTYDKTQTGRTWTNSKGVTFLQPLESEFHSFQYIDLYHPSKESMCFATPGDYLRHLSTCLEKSCGGFSLSKSVDEAFKQRGTSVSTTQQYYRLFNLELPFNKDSHARKYPLHRLFERALAVLPPDGTGSNMDIYTRFIEEYGTSYSVTSITGGLFELTTELSWAVWTARAKGGTPLTSSTCASQAEIDFLIQTGAGSPAPLLESYQSGIAGHTARCLGGVVGDAGLCKADDLSAWVATIEESPVPIKMEISDIGELIEDMEIRKNFQQAVNLYVKKQVEDVVSVKCPGGWAGSGCSEPTCELTPYKGCPFGTCQVDADNHYSQVCSMDCHWTCPARWGVFQSCPNAESGKVSVVSHCGSGQDQDCHVGECNGWDAIKCCTGSLPSMTPVNPQWKCAIWGNFIECGGGEGSIIGQCGSGRDNDCGSPCPSQSTFAIQCGGGMDQLINREQCTWLCGRWGQPLDCPAGFVAVGECGSGRDADCSKGPCAGQGSTHALKCCQLKEP